LSKPTKIDYDGQLVPAEELALEEDYVGPLVLQEIRTQGRTFLLNQPIRIEVSRFGGGWCYESKPFAILAFGKSTQEVLDSFAEDFSVLWGAIGEAPDESLTMDAIAVKHAFQQFVRTVTTE